MALAAAVALFSTPTTSNAQTVRLHGAVTLSKLISDQQAALESKAGVKLEVVGNGSGRGLTDLAAGQADIAVIAGSLKGVAQAVNQEKPGSVDPAGMKETAVNSVKLVLVVNPANGVKALTEAQARDLFSGKITNWKDVGGADQPVKIVLPFVGDGSRVIVQEEMLKGGDFAKDAIVRNSSKDIPPVIAQLPGAISFVSAKLAEGLAAATYEKDLLMPNLLVTKGDPAGDVKKVVDAVKSVIK